MSLSTAERLLAESLRPESAQAATKQLMEYVKRNKESLISLMMVVMSHADPDMKTSAALLLKRYLPKKWKSYDVNQQAEFQRLLLLKSTQDDNKTVRNTLHDLIGKFCCQYFQQWHGPVFQTIQQCFVQTDNPLVYKKYGLNLIHSVLEALCDEDEKNNLPQMQQFLQSSYTLCIEELTAFKEAVMQATLSPGSEETSQRVVVCALCLNNVSIAVQFLAEQSTQVQSNVFLHLLQVLTSLMEVLLPSPELYRELINTIQDILSKLILYNYEVFPPEQIARLVQYLFEVVSHPTYHTGESFAFQCSVILEDLTKCHPKLFTETAPGLVKDIVSRLVALANSTKTFETKTPLKKSHDANVAQTVYAGKPCGDDYDDDDEDENSDIPLVCRYVTECVDILAANLPAQLVFDPVIELIAPAFTGQSLRALQAALYIIGTIASGCHSILKAKLPELIPLLLSAAQVHQPPEIISAATFTLGQFFEGLESDMYPFHQQILNTVIPLLDHPTKDYRMKRRILFTIDACCDVCKPGDIKVYLGPLMSHLNIMLADLESFDDIALQKECLSCVVSVGHAAKSDFADYFPTVFTAIQKYVTMHEDTIDSRLKAAALLCAGDLLEPLAMSGLSPDPYCDKLIATTLEDLSSVFEDYREAVHQWFVSLCMVYKERYAPHFLPRVFESAEKMLLADNPDDISLSSSSSSVSSSSSAEEQSSHTTATREGFDATAHQDALDKAKSAEAKLASANLSSVLTGDVVDQEVALLFIIVCYRYLPYDCMSPYNDRVYACILKLQDSFMPSIHRMVYQLLQAMMYRVHLHHLPPWGVEFQRTYLRTIAAEYCYVNSVSQALCISADNQGWVPGLPTQHTLDPVTLGFWGDRVAPLLVKAVVGESMMRAHKAMLTFAELIKAFGPAAVQIACPQVDASGTQQESLLVVLYRSIEEILTHRHKCFANDDAFSDFGCEDDTLDSKESLFDAALHLVGVLAKVSGPQFLPLFEPIHQIFLKALQKKVTHPNTAQIIGCYADFIWALKDHIAPYVSQILHPVLEAVEQSEDLSLRRNGLFCYGVLLSVCPEVMLTVLQQSDPVTLLQPVCEALKQIPDDCEDESVRDNAVAALGHGMRCLRLDPAQHLVPLISVFLKYLPLKVDFEESEGILKTLCSLYGSKITRESLGAQFGDFLKAIVGEMVNAADFVSSVTLHHLKELVCDIAKSPDGRQALESIGNSNPAFQQSFRELLSVAS